MKIARAALHTALYAAAALLCCPAQAANWVQVAPVKTGKAPAAKSAIRVFVDKGSIVNLPGKQVKAWTLTSYPAQMSLDDDLHYLAVKSLHLYACEERTATQQVQVYYADSMGTSAPLRNIKYEKFTAEEIVPDSPTDYALKIVCAKALAPPPPPPAAPAPAQDGKSGK